MCSDIKNVNNAVLIQIFMSDVIHTRHDRDKSRPPGLNKPKIKDPRGNFVWKAMTPRPPPRDLAKF